ncbi:exocyst complex component Sec15 [Aspergillus luchuensis]|uniref:Exocyst complex component Sec15 n=1 Tax=Aspergillus kawachii TaxID=1069201 RepID=A0A146FP93_ASPKA|nr:exocyst complex component Sec15 [Aspergillus luchuensis]
MENDDDDGRDNWDSSGKEPGRRTVPTLIALVKRAGTTRRRMMRLITPGVPLTVSGTKQMRHSILGEINDFAVFHDGFVGDVSNEGASQSVLWCCIVIHQAGLSLGVLHEVNVWCKGISEQSETLGTLVRLRNNERETIYIRGTLVRVLRRDTEHA